jgi:hypothetical protein
MTFILHVVQQFGSQLLWIIPDVAQIKIGGFSIVTSSIQSADKLLLSNMTLELVLVLAMV